MDLGAESLTWDKLKISAKTECGRSSMYYDVRSKLILFANALWESIKLDCADIKKWWNSLEAEKVVH